MKVRPGFHLPTERVRVERRAKRLEWATLGFMTTIVVAMYLTMGSSQAMKAAWVEDLLSFIPAIAFLVAARYERRPPDQEFPYGHQRAVAIAFLAGATALTIMGLYILYDSALGLLMAERPTIGTRVLFGHQVWSGWLMIAALAYSAIPPMILGRMKMRPSRELHDKTLKADADMNRADWLTAGAGIVGILGVGLGLWWADSVAAGFISLDIVKDGFTNLKRVVGDLMDQRPTTVDGEESHVPARVRGALRQLEWVRAADVRFREEGHALIGEGFLAIVPMPGEELPQRLREALSVARSVDWRIHDVIFTLVDRDEIEGESPGDRIHRA